MVWEPERDTEGMRSASSTAVAKRLWNAGSQAKVNLTSASSRGFPDGEFEIEKPLFDIDTELGPCLPDFIVRARRGDDEMTFVVEVMGFERPDYLRGKEVTHPRMETLGPLCTMHASAFGRPGEGVGAEGRRVTETIRAALRRRWKN